MNRGSFARVSPFPELATRFNEAPIHESGKFLPTGTDGRSLDGFNEAPIHESGKSWTKAHRKATGSALQ